MLACGCATRDLVVDGRRAQRVDVDYVGQPFGVRARGLHPDLGSPSGGLRAGGGRISGNVCGIDLVYDIEHVGDRTRLVGFIDDGNYESRLEMRDADAVARVISGELARTVAHVSLELRVNRLRGVVGMRRFDLVRRGDAYVGELEYVGTRGTGRHERAIAEVHGVDTLWTLPPAVQAAVGPALLTCHVDQLEDQLGEKLVIGFGGRQTWESSHVSALYHLDLGRQMTAGRSTTAPSRVIRAVRHDPLDHWEEAGPR